MSPLSLVNNQINFFKAALVGAWGNLVNRTLAFAVKFLDCQVNPAIVDADIKERIRQLYKSVGIKIEKGTFREALREIFEVVRFGNTYYDAKQPWKTRVNNLEDCINTISNCTYLIANIAILLHPFLPFSSSKISEWLGVKNKWEEQDIGVKIIPNDISILFSKLD